MFSEKYIENVYSESGFKLAYNSKVADIYVSNNDYKGVIRAVKTFCEDVNKVTNILPEIKNDINSVSKNTVIIGTIGKSDVVDELIKKVNLMFMILKANGNHLLFKLYLILLKVLKKH